MRSLATVALLICLLTAGCVVPFPHSRVHDLGVTGRVVDADTGDAIDYARIESTSDEQTGSRVSVDTTDANGQFLVKPTSRLHGGRMHLTVDASIWPTFSRPWTWRELRISAPGYQSQRVAVSAPHGTQSSATRPVVNATFEPADDTLRDCVIQLTRVPSTQLAPDRK